MIAWSINPDVFTIALVIVLALACIGLGLAVYDGQRWLEKHDQDKHKDE